MSKAALRGSGWGLGAILLMTALASPGAAADPNGSQRKVAAGGHSHDPIEIEAAPILSKFRTPVVRPRRIISQSDGTIFVADWGAGAVTRISPKGKVTIVVQDLDEPAGLALDSTGKLYVCTHAQGMTGEGVVYRITPNGMKEVIAIGFSGPTDIAFDAQDSLYVANFHGNSISRVNLKSGSVSTFVANIAAPSSLLFDSEGDLLVLSSTEGAVYRITMTNSMMGEVKAIARGLSAPTDLALHPEGHVIAVDFGRRRLMHVTAKGNLKLFAVVPKGTIAADFDRLGNLVVANWDKPGLLKITTNLTVKCPHCGRPIPVQLRTRPMAPPKQPPKSEEKPMPPLI